MIQKIKTFLLVTIMSLGMGAPALLPATASAVINNNITQNVCKGTNNAANGSSSTDCAVSGDGETSLKDIASRIVNIFSIIVGIVAVIMIIYGGFRYITSGGDSGRVGNAKNTLIYAI